MDGYASGGGVAAFRHWHCSTSGSSTSKVTHRGLAILLTAVIWNPSKLPSSSTLTSALPSIVSINSPDRSAHMTSRKSPSGSYQILTRLGFHIHLFEGCLHLSQKSGQHFQMHRTGNMSGAARVSAIFYVPCPRYSECRSRIWPMLLPGKQNSAALGQTKLDWPTSLIEACPAPTRRSGTSPPWRGGACPGWPRSALRSSGRCGVSRCQ